MTTQIDTIALVSGASLSEPDVSRLTTQNIDGTGVFDVLMATTKLHLQEEYDEGRITGQEYSTVYLGALQAVMAQSVQFLLNTQQEEKIQAEIGLVRQKTVTELAQTDDDIPLGLGFNGDQSVEGLVASKKAIDALQADLVESQVQASEAEVALRGQQVITELAKTGSDFTQAATAGYGYNASYAIEGLMAAELEKSAQEAQLLEQKTVTEVAQTSDTKPAALGAVDSTSISGLIQSQKDKTAKEVTLLAQKIITELAQTSDAVSTDTDALNTSSTVAGMVQTQKELYEAQTRGFARDAEQKILKMLLDTWSVNATQSAATANTTNMLSDDYLGAVVKLATDGIGAGFDSVTVTA